MSESPGRLKSALSNWFQKGFQPWPVSGWEWFVVRLCFAGVVMDTFADWHPYKFESQPTPVGLARLFDLTFLHRPGMYETILALAGIGCFFYVMGRGLLVALPVLTLLSAMVRAYANSQSAIHHGYQLVTLTLLAQAIVVWWWQLRGRHRSLPLPLASYMMYYSVGVISFSYVVSAVTKIINTKGLWLWNSKYIPVEIIKSQQLLSYGDVGGDMSSQPDVSVAIWLIQHPFITQVVFGSGFLLELFAFTALRDRAWGLFIGFSLIGFHVGVEWLMGLTFHYHTLLELIFLMNLPWWFERVAFPRPLR